MTDDRFQEQVKNLAGETLGGGYRLDQLIAVSNMSVVYRALDVHTDRYVAVKILLNYRYLQRFAHEAEVTYGIQHPHIASTIRHNLNGERLANGMTIHYLVMKWISDESLSRLIKSQAPPRNQKETLEMAVNILNILSRALDYLHHSVRLVHRDIKPSNILFNERGEPCLIDFGIAKRIQTMDSTMVEGLTSVGELPGTYRYMSPEQWIGGEGDIDGRSDQYSLALAVYEFLSGGRSPYDEARAAVQDPGLTDRSNPTALEERRRVWQDMHLQEPPAPITHYMPGIPPAVDGVFSRALQKNPLSRYESVSEFAQAFQQAVFGTVPEVPLYATPPPPSSSHVPSAPMMAARDSASLYQTQGRHQRSKFFMLAGLLVLVVVLIGAGLFIVLGGDDEEAGNGDQAIVVNPTDTPTATHSSTATLTSTPTLTFTPSSSPTATLSPTPTVDVNTAAAQTLQFVQTSTAIQLEIELELTEQHLGDLTETATLWTPTPTATSSPSSTPTATPTLTPTSTQTPTPTATSVGGGGQLIVYVSLEDDLWQLYLQNVETNENRALNLPGNNLQPNWSPDGSQIAFSSDADGDFEIYVINADGSGLTKLTDNLVTDAYPRWSPDGSQIVYWSAPGDAEQIFIMNADGSEPVNISQSETRDMSPDWSPDGTQIAFRSVVDDSWEIFVMDVDGSNRRQLTTNGVLSDRPIWSPDGNQIIFHTTDGSAGEQATWRIYSMRADGSGQNVMIDRPDSRLNFDGVWSPDGSHLLFASDAEDEVLEIYMMEVRTRNITRLTSNNRVVDRFPDWQPAVGP